MKAENKITLNYNKKKDKKVKIRKYDQSETNPKKQNLHKRSSIFSLFMTLVKICPQKASASCSQGNNTEGRKKTLHVADSRELTSPYRGKPGSGELEYENEIID